MSEKPTILFLCTGNACRSQMAEGYARHLASGRFEVRSAGIEAHGLNPRAVEVMAEDGVDIKAQQSTLLSDDLLARTDVLVTVCGHADEQCPAVPVGAVKHHWPLTDPARATGSEDEVLQVFRVSRDDIRRRVHELLESLSEKQG